MKVILREDVDGLGRTGDLVDVKDGFGRNYLVPRKLAVRADAKSIKSVDHAKRQTLAAGQRRLQSIKDLAAKIEATSITLSHASGDGEKLFGSVTSREIHVALLEQGIDVDRRIIHLEEPIRSVGIFSVPVKLHPEVEAAVKLYVVAK